MNKMVRTYSWLNFQQKIVTSIEKFSLKGGGGDEVLSREGFQFVFHFFVSKYHMFYIL
jgi:hypothetical protein